MNRVIRHAFAAIVLVSSVAAPVAAQQGMTEAEREAQANDYATAVKLMRPLADKGDANAQHALGMLYSIGLGGAAPDNVAAVSWFRKAADQGLAAAQLFLGLQYDKGLGVPQDFILAYMWLNLSAGQGKEEAVQYRNMVAAKMTPAQIAEAQKLAREWKPTPTPR
jgi:uncharacterized protein